MKKRLTLWALVALLVCGAAWLTMAAQDTTITIREVRDPRTLKAWLEANATDAESRLTSGSTSSHTLELINLNNAGTAQATFQADQAADAGDKYGLVASDGGGFLFQSDKDSKGTLATKITFGNTGIITMKGGATLDNTTAANNLNITETTVTITGIGAITGNATVGGTLAVTGNTTLSGTAAITGNATAGGTLAVTGVATFTAESVHNLGIDADYITTDGGAAGGIDTKSAGTLPVGESTATKVEIADSGVETEVQGTLDVHEGLDVNEDITVDLNATDEEIVITQSSAAGTASTPLILINDDRTGATANEASEATISIDAEGVYGIAINDGGLYVEGAAVFNEALDINEAIDVDLNAADETIDFAQTAVAGTADTPFININDDRTGATADVVAESAVYIDADGVYALVVADGAVAIEGVLDTFGAAGMTIAPATATSLTLGASDITTSVAGVLRNPRFAVTNLTATTLTLTAAYYGYMVTVGTNAATTITLPANGAAAGSWVDVAVHSTSTDACAPTIAAASVDTLIGPNDVDLDSVTWATGHRIGAQAKFWSDGSFWHVQNLGGTTMTYTD